MMLEDIFAYISFETGSIWTKFGAWIASEERLTTQNFSSAESLQALQAAWESFCPV